MTVAIPLDPAVLLRNVVRPLLRVAGALVDNDRKDSPLRLLVFDDPPWEFLH